MTLTDESGTFKLSKSKGNTRARPRANEKGNGTNFRVSERKDFSVFAEAYTKKYGAVSVR